MPESERDRFVLQTSSFYRRRTIEELAMAQEVRPVERFEMLLGGWPAEEVNDGFEEAVASWRGHHLIFEERG